MESLVPDKHKSEREESVRLFKVSLHGQESRYREQGGGTRQGAFEEVGQGMGEEG